LAKISQAFPYWNVTEESIKGWHSHLADLDAGSVERAVIILIRSSPNMPTISGIRRIVLEDKLAPSPVKAWLEVQAEAKRAGTELARDFSHPAIEEATRVFGWYEIVHGTNPDYLRTQFLKAYEEIIKPQDNLILATNDTPETKAIQ
jgi:hypothetical protein